MPRPRLHESPAARQAAYRARRRNVTHQLSRYETSDRLAVVPVGIAHACRFVREHHRHLPRVRGGVFAVGATLGGRLVGVAIVGHPVASAHEDGVTCEVTRMATDGTRDACSFLYGAAWRAARALGFRRMVTYTRDDEPGSSLRAAGFVHEAEANARPSEDGAGRVRWSLYVR